MLAAVIGAGIGGTSAAYYLRQKFGRDVQIDLFEREAVGGRLATIRVEGKEYEAGGSVIHPLNLHMKAFVKELGKRLLPGSTRFSSPSLIYYPAGAALIVSSAGHVEVLFPF